MTRSPSSRQAEPSAAASLASLQALTQGLYGQRRALGRRVRLVRWCVPLPAADPWTWPAAEALGAPDAAWHDGPGAISWLAWGRACTVAQAQRPAGQRRMRQVCSQVVSALPVSAVLWQQLPLWLGTLPFFTGQKPGAGAGVPWPRQRPWRVPRLLCFRAQKATTLVLTAPLPTALAGCRALAVFWHAQVAAWQRLSTAAPSVGDIARARPAGHAAALVSQARDAAKFPLKPVPREGRGSFERRVAATLQRLARGPLHKVVLARAVACAPPRGYTPAAYASALRLRALHPDAKVFYFSYGRGTAFVGATPELLARVSGDQFHSHALAGTVRRAPTPKADGAVRRALERSGKDQAEHAAVVRGLQQALRPLCRRQATPGPPVARATQQLWHLHTPLRATLHPGLDLLDVVRALHPTPAVGGSPTALALRQLVREEGWRGDFAGPVGWLSVGGGELAVAIRSMLLTPRRAYAFAGAGIVAGSVPAAEWQETCAKLTTALGGLVWARRPAGL